MEMFQEMFQELITGKIRECKLGKSLRNGKPGKFSGMELRKVLGKVKPGKDSGMENWRFLTNVEPNPTIKLVRIAPALIKVYFN